MKEFLRRYRWPLLAWLWVLCASVWQLFVAPVLGIANNGDYSKVSGHYRLAPTVGWGVGESEYYLTDYEFAPQHRYESGLATSEHVFVWPAVKLWRLLVSKERFSLLGLAAFHLVWFLIAAAFLLAGLDRLGSTLGVVLAALWLSDAATLCYLPGFYMDTAALLFAVALAASLAWWTLGARYAWAPAWLSALGIVTSKSQHAPLAILFAAAALLYAVRRRNWIPVLAAILLLAAGARMLTNATRDYAAVPVFTLLFHRIAPTGDLLGLPEEYRRYVGLHAYSAGSPIEDPAWRDRLLTHVDLRTIAFWYARHPAAVAGFLAADWQHYAGIQPDAGLGWRRREDGYSPRSQAGGVRIWSNLRAWLAPHGLWLGLLAPVLLWRKPGFPAMALVLALAIASFAVASLADALETARHLYLFQIFADGLVLAAITAMSISRFSSAASSFVRWSVQLWGQHASATGSCSIETVPDLYSRSLVKHRTKSDPSTPRLSLRNENKAGSGVDE